MKPANGDALVSTPFVRPGWAGRWREKLFGLSHGEVRFARRGFPADVPGIRERLERAGGAFVDGYNIALRHRDAPGALSASLLALDHDLHGFAHEGAAMSLAILDQLAPWSRSRWREFLDANPRHRYLILVGGGWAMARLFRRGVPRFARGADATSWPLLYDGYGFHQAFFRPAKYVRARRQPPLAGYAAKAFDQGVGRSLWFVEGASAARIAATIGSFEPARRGDLWSGAGLACAYAGGLDRAGVAELRERAGAHADDLAQGVAFAATARVEAGNATAATELACEVLWSATPGGVADFVDEDLRQAAADGEGEVRYEAWRRRIRRRFAK